MHLISLIPPDPVPALVVFSPVRMMTVTVPCHRRSVYAGRAPLDTPYMMFCGPVTASVDIHCPKLRGRDHRDGNDGSD